MEKLRTRHLRHITKSPSHTQHLSNIDLREKWKSPSLTSIAQLKRLRYWRNAFLEPKHHIAPITAVFGKAEWEIEEPTYLTSSRISQIAKDLQELNKSLPQSLQLPHMPTASAADMFWLTTITRKQLECIQSNISTADRIWSIKFGPQNELKHACSCGDKFETKARLATHQWSSHGLTNPIRQLVQTNICPLCNQTFKDIKQAKNHAQIICAPKRNPTIVAALLKAAETLTQQNPNIKSKKYKVQAEHTDTQQRQHTIMSSFNITSTYTKNPTETDSAHETTNLNQPNPNSPSGQTSGRDVTPSTKLVGSPTTSQADNQQQHYTSKLNPPIKKTKQALTTTLQETESSSSTSTSLIQQRNLVNQTAPQTTPKRRRINTKTNPNPT
jgi:hypothetical protein